MFDDTGNTKRNYSHKQDLEERIFALDITALKQKSEEFKSAWESSGTCELCMKLTEIYELCPRKYPKTESYMRLINFLKTKGIKLNITSRKKKN